MDLGTRLLPWGALHWCSAKLSKAALIWMPIYPSSRYSKLQHIQQVVSEGVLQLAAWSRLGLQVYTVQCCAAQGRTGPPPCFKLQASELLHLCRDHGQDYLGLPAKHHQAARGPAMLMWPGWQL